MRIPDIPFKTSLEVSRMRIPAKLADRILKEIKEYILPGVALAELDKICREKIIEGNGIPALYDYRGFPGAVCISVNNVVAHGVPGNYTLKTGDILTIDLALSINGWFGDCARTYIVGGGNPDTKRLKKAAYMATQAGIAAAKAGGRFGDIGEAIDSIARRYGCSVIETLVGHGIGRDLHEDPVVPNTGLKGTGLPIVSGLVFTIEPILCLGKGEYHILDDGFTIVTSDGSLCAQYEETVALFSDHTEVLTR